MNRNLQRVGRSLAVGVAVASAAAAAALALEPSRAMATAPATVVDFDKAPLSPTLVGIATKVAARHGVATDAIVAVAPTAEGPHVAGVLVAESGSGDIVAPYNADGMTGFVPIERVADYGGVVVFASASGERGIARNASMVGIVEARVAAVELTLRDGASVEAELVSAGRRGYKFFAYVADEPQRFAVSYRAVAADGRAVKAEDVSAAVTPSRGAVG
jgi:hypothetical protein